MITRINEAGFERWSDSPYGNVNAQQHVFLFDSTSPVPTHEIIQVLLTDQNRCYLRGIDPESADGAGNHTALFNTVTMSKRLGLPSNIPVQDECAFGPLTIGQAESVLEIASNVACMRHFRNAAARERGSLVETLENFEDPSSSLVELSGPVPA